MSTVFAQSFQDGARESVQEIVFRINEFIINPIIGLLFLVAFFLFLWGVFQYFLKLDSIDRSTGTRHILWGVVGMAIMFSAYGIINFVLRTFNLD